jgi:hypothetical protein
VRDRDELSTKAEAKKQEFFARYRRYCDAFPARRHLPFAGKYLLGGKLAPLNPFRGVADAVEVLEFDTRAIVLADAGDGEIDLGTLEATATRSAPTPRRPWTRAFARSRHGRSTTRPRSRFPAIAWHSGDCRGQRSKAPVGAAKSLETTGS